ncbi:MAG: dihydroorotase, partial [Ilumatobacteraceae bacterium]
DGAHMTGTTAGTTTATTGDLVIAGGTVLDPTGRRRADVLVRDGAVVAVGVDVAASAPGATVLDAAGCIVSPGFVDLHAHLREPGREEAETIETGSRGAALGGFTAVVAMPNTDPAQDSVSTVDFVRARGEAAGLCEVLPAGCITVGRAGTQLAPYAELAGAGVRIFTDDGAGVQDPLLMRRALEYARGLDITLAQHCEVARLTDGAVMHEGSCCSRLGLPGWPSIAEELMVHRDIELVRLTGAPMHFLHLSTAGSVRLVRAAKADGLPVTAEAAPHHISLTDEQLGGYGPVFKVAPPLRTAADVAAIRAGLADGTIDAIATDHAPHTSESKELPLDQAPPGMLGLETALGVALAHLEMPLVDVVAALSWKPATIAGVADWHGRPVAAGEPANLTVFDPGVEWQVVPTDLASRSRNTPYVGTPLRGRVRHTVFRGAAVVVDGVARR